MKSNKMIEFLRVVKFTLVSISAGALEIGSYTFLTLKTPLPVWACSLISLSLAVTWNLTINRKVTFRSATNYTVALLKVLAFYAVFAPTTAFLSEWLVTTHGWNEFLVEALKLLLNFVTEFLYQRFFVFRGSIDSTKK